LTHIVKTVAHKVVKGGGIVRSIQNHGIRHLPHRFKAKYADKEGNRYYKKGRFISVYYDANPGIQKDVEKILRSDEQVLRNTHLKTRTTLDNINTNNVRNNPYLKKIIRMDNTKTRMLKKSTPMN